MRIVLSAIAGVVIALLLFWMMDALISGNRDLSSDRDSSLRLDFIQVDQDELERIKERKPPPEPEPPKKPPPPKLAVDNPDPPKQNIPQMNMPRIDLGVSSGDGPYLGGWSAENPGADGDIIPIVRIQPQYPQQARMDGISGYVVVKINVAPDGTVANAEIIEAVPRRVFNRSAMRAIYRWKFKPRVVNGQPVEQSGDVTLEFSLGAD